MKQKNIKIAICAVTAVLTFTSIDINANAATKVASVLPSAGINYTLASNATSLKNIKEDVNSESTPEENKSTNNVVSGNVSEASLTTEAVVIDEKVIEETKPVDTSRLSESILKDVSKKLDKKDEEESFKNLVIAQVDNYVNIRNTPGEDGEIVGKLYDKSVGMFLSEANGWYQIKSGSVTGYVKAEFCITGDAAVELAKKVGTRIATVQTQTLRVREAAGEDASVIGLAAGEDQLVISEELEGWVKVNIEEGDGFISTDFVSLSTEFVQAESKEEEAARLAKEEAERKAAQTAAARKAAERTGKSGSSNKEEITYTSSGGSATGRAVADYALQFVGNPYVWGGTSLTNGADCSGFVMSVYENFGVGLPHSSSADRNVGSAVNGLENAQPGDLICYSGHVALYIGNGQIVHASTSKTGIIVSNANYRTPLSVRRIF